MVNPSGLDSEVFFFSCPLDDAQSLELQLDKIRSSKFCGAYTKIIREFLEGKVPLGDVASIEKVRLNSIYVDKFVILVVCDVLFPSKEKGKDSVKGTYRWLRRNHSSEAKDGTDQNIGVLCVTNEGKIVLVKEYRVAVSEWCWSIPQGTRSEELPLEESCAKEAFEEAGVTKAQGAELSYLGYVHGDPSLVASTTHLYFMPDCVADPTGNNRDETESEFKIKEFFVNEIKAMIANNEIVDGGTIAAISKAMMKGLL